MKSYLPIPRGISAGLNGCGVRVNGISSRERRSLHHSHFARRHGLLVDTNTLSEARQTGHFRKDKCETSLGVAAATAPSGLVTPMNNGTRGPIPFNRGLVRV